MSSSLLKTIWTVGLLGLHSLAPLLACDDARSSHRASCLGKQCDAGATLDSPSASDGPSSADRGDVLTDGPAIRTDIKPNDLLSSDGARLVDQRVQRTDRLVHRADAARADQRVKSPSILASGQLQPRAIVVDPQFVYWTAYAGASTNAVGAVRRTAKQGGGPLVTIAEKQAHPIGLTVVGDTVFWTNYTGGQLMSAPSSASGPPRVITTRPSWVHVWGVTADSKRVYWTERSANRVVAIDRNGANLTVLAKSQSGAASIVLHDNNTLYWTNAEATPFFPLGDELMSAATSGANVRQIASGQSAPLSLEIRGKQLYWINSGSAGKSDGAVASVALSGGQPTILASGQSEPKDIAVDDHHVYWTAYNTGRLMRVANSGGTPEVVASGLSYPYGVAVDETAVYWTTEGDGKVHRLSK